MARMHILIKDPDERESKFNARLKEACTDPDYPVTDATLGLVDGQPMVCLESEVKISDVEDVKEGLAEEEGLFLVDADEQICVKVCKLFATEVDESMKSENRLNKAMEEAGEYALELEVKSNEYFSWVTDPNSKQEVYLPGKATWAMVIFSLEALEDRSEDNPGQEDKLEQEDNSEQEDKLEQEVKSEQEDKPKTKTKTKKKQKEEEED